MGANANVFGKLGWADSGTADKAFSFISESLRKTGTHTNDDGMRGTRSHQGERIREGNFGVGGTIVMEPNYAEWVDILKFIGFSASGTTYSLLEVLTPRDITIDRGTKVFTYAGCKVASATFTSSEGSPLRVALDIVGQTETVGNAGTFPSLSYTDAAPFMHYDATASVVSSSRDFKSVSVTFNNAPIVSYNNSQSADFIVAGDRIVGVDMVTPYSSSEVALYNQAVAGTAATLTYTYNSTSMLFTFATVQTPDNSPVLQAKNGETILQLSGQARMSGSTRECVITFDSTP